ncbi:hypothetical protein HG531_000502 [Fusarium graminearum]|nr:hypothetical protein HG531_000502 [Fusarium graminearum]
MISAAKLWGRFETDFLVELEMEMQGTASNIGKVELLPGGEQGDQEGETNKSDGHGEDSVQAVHIALYDDRECLFIESLTESGSASKDQLALVDVRSVLCNIEEHLIDKSSLTTRDDIGTTKTLEDYAFGRSKILGVDCALDSNHRNLESQTPADTSNNLETSTDGSNSCTTNKQRLIPSGSSDEASTGNSGEGDSKNQGEVANTTACGRSIVYRLEVDGNVVDGKEEGASEDEGESAHDPNCAVLEDTDRNHGSLTLHVTGDGPNDRDGDPTNKKTDDNRGVPSVSLATILNSQNVGDGETHHQDDTKGIHLEELLKKRSLNRNGSTRSLEEQKDDGSRDTSDGEVDVETPSPRDVIGSANDTSKGRSLLGRSRETDDGVGSSTKTCTTDTSDGTTSDQSLSVGSSTTNDRAKLKDENGNEEGCLEREVLVDFTPFWWRTDGHEEGCTIPTDLVKALELISDLGDGNGGSTYQVKGEEEDSHDQGEDNEEHVDTGWVVIFFRIVTVIVALDCASLNILVGLSLLLLLLNILSS